MQRIGIYGGSFNPVHFGHVGLAKWVIENTDLDELWLMVSPLNPLKANASASNSASDLTSNFQQRLAAVREAVKDIPGVKVSDFEFSLPRPSYTANTLRSLQQAYPGVEFTLVIGEDNITIFDRWREYEYILANFRIFVYPRMSSRQTEGAASAEEGYKNLFPGVAVKELRFLTAAPYFNISSTEIRAEMSRISPQPSGS
ncbi:MAG: nicotinate (nicotinamide) nucleotide adenylyltransferase [Paludibacteraceae bacterium]|nr:nicotinate (nicotinamide) nucleotide adenylyltransferase [Paludibacteraceae bacterium]